MAKTQKESKEDALVEAFLVCTSITGAAKKAGVSRGTAYKIMESDSFKKKLAKAKYDALQNVVCFLQGNLTRCASVLMKVIIDDNANQQTRINACQIFMNQCKLWLDETDILTRLDKLECAMEKEKGEHGGGNYKKAVRP